MRGEAEDNRSMFWVAPSVTLTKVALGTTGQTWGHTSCLPDLTKQTTIKYVKVTHSNCLLTEIMLLAVCIYMFASLYACVHAWASVKRTERC